MDLGAHLRDEHGHLFLCDLETIWPWFKVGQSKIKNMHFSRLSQNWVLKADLDTHLKDKHGHLFLWDLELFLPLLNIGQMKDQGWKYALFSSFSELSFENFKWI